MGYRPREILLPSGGKINTISNSEIFAENMGTLLTTAFAHYRQHFWLIASLTLVVWLPCDLIQSYLEYHVFDPEDTRASFKLSQFFSSFFGIIAVAGILQSLDLSAAGIRPTFAMAMGAGFSYWPRMWFANFLFGLAFIIGFLLLIVPAFILLIRCALLEQVVVRETVTGVTAIQRSFALTKGHFWKVCGWFFVASMIAFSVGFPLLFLTLIPVLDWWLPDGIFTALYGIPSMYIVVFGWVVYNHLADIEAARETSV